MPDISTTYLGLRLKNPLVVSASPLSKKGQAGTRLEAAGASAIVLYSLFEEQITHESHELDHYLSRGSETYAEALSYFPEMEHYNIGPERYLEHLQRLEAGARYSGDRQPQRHLGRRLDRVAQKDRAGRRRRTGAEHLLPADRPQVSGAELEDTYVNLVRTVREQVRIPIALKLSPFVTALPKLAQRFAAAGADGLVLFNRFYQPDFDLEALEVVPSLTLSNSG